MRVRSKLHQHICMKCSVRGSPTVWEHDTPECYVPHPTEKNCPKCSKDDGDSPKDFHHGHYCGTHKHEWEHADKACLLHKKDAEGIPEVWTLNCPGQDPKKQAPRHHLMKLKAAGPHKCPVPKPQNAQTAGLKRNGLPMPPSFWDMMISSVPSADMNLHDVFRGSSSPQLNRVSIRLSCSF